MAHACACCSCAAGLTSLQKSRLDTAVGAVNRHSPFKGKAADAANAFYRSSLVHARDLGTWQRKERWLADFATYAKNVCKESGLRYSEDDALASDHLVRLFLSAVGAEDKGPTRPRAARRFLSAERMRRGMRSLLLVEAISHLIKGVENASPRTKKQAAPIHEDEICGLLERFNATWYETQVATMAGVGFLTLMRVAELRQVKLKGVVWVLKSGRHVYADENRALDLSVVKAVLFHVPWRKSSQAKDVWIPLSCPTMMARVRNQCKLCLEVGTPFLFPARKRASGWPMNTVHPIGRAQFQKELQRGLVKHCGFEAAVAALMTGHCLRVGGSNYMRRLGIADEVHRRMGGWMHLQSSQGYMVLTPAEQAETCAKMALTNKRASAFTQEEAGHLLRQLSPLVL